LENAGQKIVVINYIDSISYQCVFYNLDYTEFRTVSIELGPLFIISQYNSPLLDIRYIAESVFDQDNDIDILAQLTYYDDAYDEYAQVVVFHENGNTLFESDVDNSNAWLFNSSIANSSMISSLVNTETGAKMILDAYYFDEGLYSFDVYDLPGSLPSTIGDSRLPGEIAGNYLRAFPVPANEYINMDYKLTENQNSGIIEIVDEQGKTLQKIRIDANRGIVRVPVTHYNNGLYFYKLNTKRGASRTGKVVILK
jgi:hypothetical protein